MAPKKVAGKKTATPAKKRASPRPEAKAAKPKAKPTRAKTAPEPAKPAPKKREGSAKGAISTRKKTAAKPATRSSRRSGAPAQKPTAQRTRELGVLREQLHDAHRDLMQAYVSAKGDTRERQGDGTEDYIDYAVSSYDREFMLSLTETQQRQLLLIEDALRRIDRGEYGRCMQCDKEVPSKRLEVQPWAQYCVGCQELADQGLLEPRTLEDLDDEDLDDEEEMEEIEGEVEIDDSLHGDEKNADGSDKDDDEDEETIGL